LSGNSTIDLKLLHNIAVYTQSISAFLVIWTKVKILQLFMVFILTAHVRQSAGGPANSQTWVMLTHCSKAVCTLPLHAASSGPADTWEWWTQYNSCQHCLQLRQSFVFLKNMVSG